MNKTDIIKQLIIRIERITISSDSVQVAYSGAYAKAANRQLWYYNIFGLEALKEQMPLLNQLKEQHCYSIKTIKRGNTNYFIWLSAEDFQTKKKPT